VISAQHAIARARRDLTIGTLLKGLLLVVAVGALLMGPLSSRLGLRFDATLVLMIVGAIWVVLGMQSARNSRMVAESPSLIASGQFDVAEQQITGALRSFSIFRAVKLLSLHHLAALRHAQKRWSEAAMLCRALLSQKKVEPAGLGRSTRLLLADSLLELNDTREVGDCVARLYDQRLSLGEALSLLLVQLDYESRLGAWNQMTTGIMTKVSLAELMPTARSARTQALLALAAKKSGREDWANWLRRRAELLVDPIDLYTPRPLLRELWLS
jgi:hypothetical protein